MLDSTQAAGAGGIGVGCVDVARRDVRFARCGIKKISRLVSVLALRFFFFPYERLEIDMFAVKLNVFERRFSVK